MILDIDSLGELPYRFSLIHSEGYVFVIKIVGAIICIIKVVIIIYFKYNLTNSLLHVGC